MDDVELVVARCHENVAWLGNVPKGLKITVYDKGGGASSIGVESLALPNVGREAHTYLYHLVKRCDSLAKYTVFAQGHPFDHVSNFHKILRELVSQERQVAQFQWLGFILDTDDDHGRKLFQSWSKNTQSEELALGEFYCELFGEEKAPEKYRFFPGAHFVVTREQILSRSLDFYQKALKLSVSFPHAAHCFERLWDRVFGVNFISDEMMGGQETVYLKRIKRLETPRKLFEAK